MRFEETGAARVGVARVWAALVDVTDWARWSRSITSVERLDEGPLRVGSRARVRQPGMPDLVWVVDELREPEVFVWSTRSPGIRTVGSHVLTALPDGGTRIELAVDQSGPLAGLVGLLTGRRTRRYLGYEAAALKAAAEAEG
jgi:hypothetical protein